MITCPSCGHKNNPWANACVKCTEPLTSKSKEFSSEIVGYKCPACKTNNYGNRTHCFKCGHWLLDTKFQAEPIVKDDKNTKVHYGYNDYQTQPKPKTSIIGKIFMGLGVVFLILLVIGSISNPSKQTSVPAVQTSPQSSKPDLELIENGTENGEFGTGYIVGSIRNNTSRRYGYVQIEINLYDDSMAQVGSTMANANNLEPGGIWRFKAPLLERNARQYRVVNIKGF